MSETDEFDNFLKNGFEKEKNDITDDGFTEKVISGLPSDRILINRKFILYFSGALSAFIFYISNGYKSLLLSIIDILSNGFHSIRPSLISFFVVLVFISVAIIISRIEHDEDLI